jgi:bacterioferritin-associated ferredoxin
MALVCLCHGVSERRVRREIEAGASCVEDVAAGCAAGSCCHGCHPTIEALIDDHVAAAGVPRRRRFAVA